MTNPSATEQFGLLQSIESYRTTAIIVAVVRSGVLEQLSSGSKYVSEIIENLGWHENHGRRFLMAIGALKFIEVDQDLCCTLSDTGRALCADSPLRLRERANLISSEYAGAWFALHESLVTGRSAYEEAYGGETVWAHRTEDPVAARWFRLVMQTNLPHILRALDSFPFEEFNCVADLGGADGTVLCELLGRHPHLKGILIDLDVDGVEADFEPPGDRLVTRSGDFFEDDVGGLVEGADLIMLCHVVHDWNDADAVRLLQRCRAAQESPKILVVDRVLGEQLEPVDALRDLHMMALTGGQERTRAHFADLFSQADLTITREGEMWMLLSKP